MEPTDTAQIARLQAIVDSSASMVFFGGAGVSTESGIPDFRSGDGLYSQTYAHPPEEMLSHSFLEAHAAEFFTFYRERVLALDAQPNAAHHKLAQWEREGKLRAVITQNIDGLHQKAGSKNVLELHGSIHRNHCLRCGKAWPGEHIQKSVGIPMCICGGMVRPDVVLYEEGLDSALLERAVQHIGQADTLIIGGTSLVVYPAAGLVDYFRGKHLVVINKGGQTRGRAELLLTQPIGSVLQALR